MYQGAADGWQNENVFLMIANQLAPGLVDEAQNGKSPWTSARHSSKQWKPGQVSLKMAFFSRVHWGPRLSDRCPVFAKGGSG